MLSACWVEGSSQPLVLTRRICDSWPSCGSVSRILVPSRSCYPSDCRVAEAEALERKLMEMQRRVLGAGHPDTLATFSELGFALCQRKDTLPLLRRLASC